MGEHLPDGFSARPARSQKEIAEHCEAKVSMLSDAPILSILTTPGKGSTVRVLQDVA